MSKFFKKGSGVYTCAFCKHATRDTGGGGVSVGACDICYDLAGEENHLSDHGSLYSERGARADIEALDKRNGQGTALALFPEVAAAVAALAN